MDSFRVVENEATLLRKRRMILVARRMATSAVESFSCDTAAEGCRLLPRPDAVRGVVLDVTAVDGRSVGQQMNIIVIIIKWHAITTSVDRKLILLLLLLWLFKRRIKATIEPIWINPEEPKSNDFID